MSHIRDLQFPDDARRVISSLQEGLRYDAATAVLGNAARELPVPHSGDLSTGIRLGSRVHDEAVRRDAPGLLARFALISMVGRA